MTLVYKYDVKGWGAVLALLLVLVARAAAQTPTGSVRGQVTDPSGAAVAGATDSRRDVGSNGRKVAGSERAG